jgi:hypothetical protein
MQRTKQKKTMKNNLIFTTVGLLFSFISLYAQDFQIGASVGIDASRFALSGASGGPLQYRSDLAGGLFVEKGFSSTIGLQMEINYSAQGAGVINADGSTAASYQMNYITIPALVKLYGTPSLSFMAGPQVGFLTGATVKVLGDPDQDVKSQLNSMDLYAVFGTEYRFENGVFIGARYNLGLLNAAEDLGNNVEILNRYFCFRIGYSFKL